MIIPNTFTNHPTAVSQRDLFLTAPANASPDQIRAFHDLIDLLAHIADCYPEALRSFPDDLAAILTQHHAVLHPELRDKIVGSFGLLRRKDILDSPAFARTLFPILVHTPSKTLRTLLFRRIVSDLRNANNRTKNHKLNRTVQTVLFNLVTSDRTSARPIWAVKITRELWTRQIWVDERPVEVMREACLGDNEKVVVSAVRFFLGGDKAREELEDDSSDDEGGKNKYGGVLGGGAGGPVDLKKMKQGSLHSKKTKKMAKRLERAVDKVKKMERKKQQPHMLNFSALVSFFVLFLFRCDLPFSPHCRLVLILLLLFFHCLFLSSYFWRDFLANELRKPRTGHTSAIRATLVRTFFFFWRFGAERTDHPPRCTPPPTSLAPHPTRNLTKICKWLTFKYFARPSASIFSTHHMISPRPCLRAICSHPSASSRWTASCRFSSWLRAYMASTSSLFCRSLAGLPST